MIFLTRFMLEANGFFGLHKNSLVFLFGVREVSKV